MNEEIEIFPIEETEVLDSIPDSEIDISDTEIVNGTESIENMVVIESVYEVETDAEILEEVESAADPVVSETSEMVQLLSEPCTEYETEVLQTEEVSSCSETSSSSFDSLIFLLFGFMVVFLILTRLER